MLFFLHVLHVFYLHGKSFLMAKSKKPSGRSITLYLDGSVILGLTMDAEAQERSVSYIANQLLKQHYQRESRREANPAPTLPPHASLPEAVEDKFTILHYSFQTGEPKRYTLPQVKDRVRRYSRQLARAQGTGREKRIRERKQYWEGKQQELEQKLQN